MSELSGTMSKDLAVMLGTLDEQQDLTESESESEKRQAETTRDNKSEKSERKAKT